MWKVESPPAPTTVPYVRPCSRARLLQLVLAPGDEEVEQDPALPEPGLDARPLRSRARPCPADGLNRTDSAVLRHRTFTAFCSKSSCQRTSPSTTPLSSRRNWMRMKGSTEKKIVSLST